MQSILRIDISCQLAFNKTLQPPTTTSPIIMNFLAVLCIAAVLVCQVVVAVPVETFETPVADAVREQRSFGAPPSYGAPVPVYAAPPRLGPARSYSYQSPAPTIPCGQALVFSCAPSVAPAPCAAAAPSYGGY